MKPYSKALNSAKEFFQVENTSSIISFEFLEKYVLTGNSTKSEFRSLLWQAYLGILPISEESSEQNSTTWYENSTSVASLTHNPIYKPSQPVLNTPSNGEIANIFPFSLETKSLNPSIPGNTKIDIKKWTQTVHMLRCQYAEMKNLAFMDPHEKAQYLAKQQKQNKKSTTKSIKAKKSNVSQNSNNSSNSSTTLTINDIKSSDSSTATDLFGADPFQSSNLFEDAPTDSLDDMFLVNDSNTIGFEDDGGAFDDPLAQSSDSGNVWSQYFQTNSLKQKITKDVDRTFPSIPMFKKKWVAKLLSDVLFVHAVEYPDLEYKQGMHELLAVSLYLSHKDRAKFHQHPAISKYGTNFSTSNSKGIKAFQHTRKLPESFEDNIAVLMDPAYLEHDCYWLLFAMIRCLGSFFAGVSDKNKALGKRKDKISVLQEEISDCVKFKRSAAELEERLALLEKEQPVIPSKDEISKYPWLDISITPIVAHTRWLFHSLVRSRDTQLYQHLEKLGVEPQLYFLRWQRCILTREFPLDDALNLWDAVFYYRHKQSLPLLDYVCVAMLLSIRNRLMLIHDSGGIYGKLLHYPPTIDVFGFIAQAFDVLAKKPIIVKKKVENIANGTFGTGLTDLNVSSGGTTLTPSGGTDASTASTASTHVRQLPNPPLHHAAPTAPTAPTPQKSLQTPQPTLKVSPAPSPTKKPAKSPLQSPKNISHPTKRKSSLSKFIHSGRKSPVKQQAIKFVPTQDQIEFIGQRLSLLCSLLSQSRCTDPDVNKVLRNNTNPQKTHVALEEDGFAVAFAECKQLRDVFTNVLSYDDYKIAFQPPVSTVDTLSSLAPTPTKSSPHVKSKSKKKKRPAVDLFPSDQKPHEPHIDLFADDNSSDYLFAGLDENTLK